MVDYIFATAITFTLQVPEVYPELGSAFVHPSG